MVSSASKDALTIEAVVRRRVAVARPSRFCREQQARQSRQELSNDSIHQRGVAGEAGAMTAPVPLPTAMSP